MRWFRLATAAVLCGAAGVASAAALQADAQVLRKLAALGANEAVVLGQARVLGAFNDVARAHGLDRTGPRSRDFSIKMVWAPERRRALFAGANHGSPHRLNDVWEFDLAALAWVLAYPPDHPRSYRGLGEDPSDVVFDGGWLVTRRGGPAVIGHAWWGLTYDPGQRRMLFMNTWVTDEDGAVRQLGGDPARRFRGPPLWSFDPAAGTWAAVETEPPWPGVPFGAMLEHVPELGGTLWHMNNWQMSATWLYDANTRRWTDLKANAASGDFESQAPGIEAVAYHDGSRRLIVARQGRDTFHFDTARRQWTKVAAAGGEAVPVGHDDRTPFHFDRASGHGLLVDLRTRTLWAYDPDGPRWTRLAPRGSPMPAADGALAYVDPARQVLVVIANTTVWAYRYRAPDPVSGR